MTDPKPWSSTLEFQGFLLAFKGYLKSNAFSYRCKNYYTCQCPYLLTIPIENNFSKETWTCTGLDGAYQSSSKSHSEACIKQTKSKIVIEGGKNLIFPTEDIQANQIIEWKFDVNFLRNYIRQNPRLGPKTIQGEMRKFKQEFTLRLIKEKKKEVLDELFPKDKKIAFCPANCLSYEASDNYEDNLFRYSAQFPMISKSKATKEENLHQQEFYIFDNNTMLLQLENAKQWFIDGTFSVAPQGFQQLITIVVYLPECRIFYPACYIIATNKSETIYSHCFRALTGIAEEEGFKLEPEVIMSI